MSDWDEVADLLRAYLERMHEDEASRGPVQHLLRDTLDLAAFPTDLTRVLSLAPPLYNAATRRFEFQRTPTIFPTGRIAAAGAGATRLANATGFGGIANTNGTDLTPKDARVWKLLGGMISCSAAATVIIREDGGARQFAGVVFTAAGFQPFALPGNGAEVSADSKRSFEVFVSAAANIDFVLFVSEESDTTGRGGV